MNSKISLRTCLGRLAMTAAGLFVPEIYIKGQSFERDLPFRRGVGASTPSNGLLAGTLGYWKMDETLATGGSRADATGHGWTATDVTGTIPSATGLLNNAANINTNGKGLSISASIDQRAQTTPYAISYWINPATITAGAGMVATLNSGGIQGFLLYFSSNGAVHNYSTDDAGTVTDVGSAPDLTTGSWFHILSGFDGTHMLRYTNGANLQSNTLNGLGISRGHQVLALGNYSSFGATGVPCLIDEVAYLNFWPNPTQAALLYNGGTPLPFSSYS